MRAEVSDRVGECGDRARSVTRAWLSRRSSGACEDIDTLPRPGGPMTDPTAGASRAPVPPPAPEDASTGQLIGQLTEQIGRAACRERGQISEVAGSLKK